MDQYFTYSFTVSCGIPEITLEGTTEDWQLIEKKAAALAKYDLEWWTKDLQTILAQFTKASTGDIDRDFWASMFHQNSKDVVCAMVPYFTGWFARLFPYFENPTEDPATGAPITGFAKNPIIGKSDKELYLVNKDGKITYTGPELELDSFTSGLSKADFLYNDNGTFYKMEFLGGFIGIEQDEKTLALRPKISWAVVDTGEKPNKKDLENYFKSQKEPKAVSGN